MEVYIKLGKLYIQNYSYVDGVVDHVELCQYTALNAFDFGCTKTQEMYAVLRGVAGTVEIIEKITGA